MSLEAILHRLRPPRREELEALRVYRGQLRNVLARARGIHAEWLALAEVATDELRLANVASVNRWELLRLGEQVDALTPPRRAEAAHRAIQRAIGEAARAYQLLATGQRFHKSEAVCDGQALLLDSLDVAAGAERAIDVLLAQARG